ncbi:MAG: tetratricopeptide repeat protein [Polyangiaceae bacterium]
MDRFSAHLDRGWDLVQRGDSKGAEASARRALELNSQAPEAYNLLGYAAALEGDFEEAIEHYSRALSLDETYFEAMLNAAEVFIHPLEDYPKARQMCDRALQLAETDDELVDALLLMFDALLGENLMDQARALCERFPAGPFDNPNHLFLVGRALYEVGQVKRAAPLIEQAVKVNPENAEAHYYLGLLRDEQGNQAQATQAFLEARMLDLDMPEPAWSLSRDAFEHTVRQAILALPERLRSVIRLGEVHIGDVPGMELVVDGVDPRALVILDDISLGRGGAPTARLFVYQRNLERLAGTLEAIETELSAALEREISSLLDEEEHTELNAPPDKSKLN